LPKKRIFLVLLVTEHDILRNDDTSFEEKNCLVISRNVLKNLLFDGQQILQIYYRILCLKMSSKFINCPTFHWPSMNCQEILFCFNKNSSFFPTLWVLVIVVEMRKNNEGLMTSLCVEQATSCVRIDAKILCVTASRFRQRCKTCFTMLLVEQLTCKDTWQMDCSIHKYLRI
jgi:hypothetical protein